MHELHLLFCIVSDAVGSNAPSGVNPACAMDRQWADPTANEAPDAGMTQTAGDISRPILMLDCRQHEVPVSLQRFAFLTVL